VKWSFRIASVAGIEVRIHVTFLLILGVFALLFANDGGLEAAVFGTLFFLALFFCVVLHEFGHAFAARAYGIRTPDITLYPIGGVARLERMPTSPWHEFVIALAGPAVNVAIAGVLWLGVVRGYSIKDLLSPHLDGDFWSALLRINIVLVMFNMIPAFPMDGGRVVRALLATRLPYAMATLIAARIGQAIAIAFVVASFTDFEFASPMLLVIGMFVFMGAQQELNFARLRQSAQSVRVADAMLGRFEVLPDDLRVGELASRLLISNQEVFIFADDDMLYRGLALREELVQGVRQLPEGAFAQSLSRNVSPVRANASMHEVLEVMQKSQEPFLPVINGAGQVVGLVGIDQMQELVRLAKRH
jgi:Zn-dependent protease/CBS domain-containing protein